MKKLFILCAMVCGLGMSVLAQNFYTMTFDMDGDTLRIATWLHGDSEYRGNDYVLLSQSAKILTVDDDDTVPYRRSLYSTLEASNAIEVLNRAIEEHGKPEIVNSDQGSQYTCQKWTDTLEEKRIAISMDGRGRCRDNAWIERFWRTLKTEYVYLNPWSEAALMRDGISSYIDYYNKRRCHSSIGHMPPAKLFFGKASKAA